MIVIALIKKRSMMHLQIKVASSKERALAPVLLPLGDFRKTEHGWQCAFK